jgi:hypothetical protein
MLDAPLLRVSLHVSLVNRSSYGANDKLPALRHGIARVDSEVQITKLNIGVAVRVYRPQFRVCGWFCFS